MIIENPPKIVYQESEKAIGDLQTAQREIMILRSKVSELENRNMKAQEELIQAFENEKRLTLGRPKEEITYE